jgi:hypothetical protein
MFIFVDLEIKLNEELLIRLLQLLYVGLSVLEQVHLLSLQFVQLSFESVSVKLELVF